MQPAPNAGRRNWMDVFRPSASRHIEPKRRHLRGAAWAIGLAVSIVAVTVYLFVDSDTQTALYNSIGAISSLAIMAGVILHRPARWRTWLVFAVGIALYTAGDVVYSQIELQGDVPFPSLADGFYLVGMTTIAVAILGLFRGRVPGGDRAGLIDAAILTIGSSVLAWVWLMEPYLQDETLTTEAVLVALAYPMIDVLLIGVVARLFLSPGRRFISSHLILVALTLYLAADVVYALQSIEGSYVGGTVLDLGWLLGYSLWATSALHPSMVQLAEPAARVDPKLTGVRFGLLAGASLIAPTLLLVPDIRAEPRQAIALVCATIVLFTLVLLRLANLVTALRVTLHEQRRLEAKLEHQANHDHLTGLSNRALFGERLALAVADPNHQPAVLLLDLDDFKTVNDSLGHAAGDELLIEVADRIRRSVRATDLAARLGGDEFAVLLDGSPDIREASMVARRILEALTPSALVADQSIHIGASIGVAIRTDASVSPEDLNRNADIAMYMAKSQGKGRYELFQPEMHAEVVRRTTLRAELESALDEGQLVLHYQPIVRLSDRRLVGVEALVRWLHPERGLLGPAEFLPLAEETGLILPLGRWVLNEACRQVSAWGAQIGDDSLRVSVNVSDTQLRDPRLGADVAAALSASGLAPSQLVIELTEGALLDPSATPVALRALKALGVRISLDDFGTGYSSLSYLALLPLDELKVDRAFVAALARDGREAALADAVLRLSASLDLDTVAEGIEDEGQLLHLTDLGCTYGQGYHLARPMSPAALESHLGLPPAPERPKRAGFESRELAAT